MSVAGAQHTMRVIAKGAESFDGFLTMRLARAARLTVPRVDMRYVPESVYRIERFGREVDDKSLRKVDRPTAPTISPLHIIDA